MSIWSAEIKELGRLYESFKGQFPKLKKELVRLLKTDDENIILVYSRRCLEVIITDLCECELKRDRGTEPLKGIIDKLNKEKKIPSNIITSMDHLNSLSAYGAHPRDFDPEQVKPVLNNLDIIIKWYLKYKKSKTNITGKSEEVKEGGLASDDTAERIQKPKKKLILLLSSLTLVVALVVVALFVLNIIGGGNKNKELEKSIAVLPFRNDSPDQEMYFINGVMEEILDNLCKIEDIRVVSRSSVEQYRNNPKPIPVVGEEMDVGYILEGSGQRDGDNIRLTVQLLDGKKDQHIWSESYYRELKNIFELQSEIAQLVAEEIKAVITPAEKDLIEKVPTKNLTAYDFYQRGREEHRKYNFGIQNKEVLERAETLYNYAIENDSIFAKAYIGLASVYWSKHYWEEYYSENFLDSVLILANIALSFDKQLAEAYVARGRYYLQFNKRGQAIEEFNKAIELNPNDWTAYHALGSWYQEVDLVKAIFYHHKSASLNSGPELPSILRSLSAAYLSAGFVENAKYYDREILRLDGDSVAYYLHLSNTEFILGNTTESIDLLERGFAIDSVNIDILSSLVFRNLISGRYEESLKYYEKNLNKLYNVSESRVMKYGFRGGFIFMKNGLKEEANHYLNASIEILTKEKELTSSEPGAAVYYDLAAAYAFKGEHQKAYENLRLFNQKPLMSSNDVIIFKTDPLFENIREESEFQQIARDVEAKYQAEHERVRKWLEENGML